MGAYRNAVGVMFKRPFILVFFGLLMLIYSVINLFNPFFTLLVGLSAYSGGNALEGIIPFLQLMLNPAILLKGLPFVLGLLIILALFIGVVFSGYFYVIRNAVGGIQKSGEEYRTGLKKYFMRVSSMSFRVLLFGLVFILFGLVASVPAIVVNGGLRAGKVEFFVASVILDVLTIGVLFFGFMFFRIYAFFWYPAALNGEKRAFGMGKRLADAHFWEVVRRFIVFDIVFAVFQTLYVSAGYLLSGGQAGVSLSGVALFVVNWLFNTFFFASMITYVFSAFKLYKEERVRKQADPVD